MKHPWLAAVGLVIVLTVMPLLVRDTAGPLSVTGLINFALLWMGCAYLCYGIGGRSQR